MNKIARRQFINACYKVGLFIGLTSLASRLTIQHSVAQTSMSTDSGLVDNVDTKSNRKNSPARVLVVYASQFGSTGGVAERVSSQLAANGHQVEVKQVDHVESLDGYDAIIIGGAIQYDRWMTPARKFVEIYKTQLAKIPCACFFVCLTLSRTDEKSLARARVYAQKIAALFPANPLSVQGFAGVLDYSKMSFATRMFAKTLMAIIGVKEGDYRNWPAVDGWSNTMASVLLEKNIRQK